MKLVNDKIVMDKEEFVINTLMMGVATQLLANHSPRSVEDWMDYLSKEADMQLENIKKNNPQQIDQIVNLYTSASNA